MPPAKGLREATPSVHVLRGATVHVSAEKTVENATLVVRDGIITAIGRDVNSPPDATVWDVSGKRIYPGFIDAYSEVLAGGPRDEAPAAGYFNPHRDRKCAHSAAYEVNAETNRRLRSQGIALRLVAPRGAVVRGRSMLITTGDDDPARIAQQDVALHVQLDPLVRSHREAFPNSIMEGVALVRQALCDARWHCQALAATRDTPLRLPPEPSLALETLAPYALGEKCVILEAPDELAFLRADALAREFGLKAILRGSGSEYRRLDAIRATGRAVIVPLAWPVQPSVQTLEETSRSLWKS